jgi:hypothetical protein
MTCKYPEDNWNRIAYYTHSSRQPGLNAPEAVYAFQGLIVLSVYIRAECTCHCDAAYAETHISTLHSVLSVMPANKEQIT